MAGLEGFFLHIFILSKFSIRHTFVYICVYIYKFFMITKNLDGAVYFLWCDLKKKNPNILKRWHLNWNCMEDKRPVIKRAFLIGEEETLQGRTDDEWLDGRGCEWKSVMREEYRGGWGSDHIRVRRMAWIRFPKIGSVQVASN